MAELFDSHAHIQESEFREDVGAVVERARIAGVATVLVPAVDLQSAEQAVGLAGRFPGLYVAAGYHPHEAARFSPSSLTVLESLLDHPAAVAVGEIGLDFYRLHSPRREQIICLEAMLGLAGRRRLPVVVHCRDASEEIEAVLGAWSAEVRPAYAGRPLGVMHYFSGDAAAARRYVELGFLVSIHTSVTHPRAEGLRSVARELPLESLVVETDSPYGAPQAYRGRRNEPAFVVEAAKLMASLRGCTFEEVAAATTANARRLFGLDRAAGPLQSAADASPEPRHVARGVLARSGTGGAA